LHEEFIRRFGDDTAGPRHVYEASARQFAIRFQLALVWSPRITTRLARACRCPSLHFHSLLAMPLLAASPPRNRDLTLYLMPGVSRYPELLAKLATLHAKPCLYIKRLADVDVSW
jgi:hypothetical protein